MVNCECLFLGWGFSEGMVSMIGGVKGVGGDVGGNGEDVWDMGMGGADVGGFM